MFDIVDRDAFERRLNEQVDIASPRDDPAWYALRNVVYAFGCRASIFQETVPETWTEAQTKAWGYFENALSVHTELVYFRSNLASVQALLAMVSFVTSYQIWLLILMYSAQSLFVEGSGTPKLEYMLISTTVRLAQSKGFHLRPGTTSKLGTNEIGLRTRMFWAMYFYEKHIAYRAGRPSVSLTDNYLLLHALSS